MATVGVLMIGANAVGKTTTARKIAEKFGGFNSVADKFTTTNSGLACFGGKYVEGINSCGCDTIQPITQLPNVAEKALKVAPIFFAEGMMLGTFGLTPMNTIHKADKQLVVLLYAPVEVCIKRIMARTKNGHFNAFLSKYKGSAAAAKKYQSIGIPVLTFDTSVTSAEEVADTVYNKIIELWSGDK